MTSAKQTSLSKATDFSDMNAEAQSGARAAPQTFSIPARYVLEMERLGISPEFIDRLFGPREQIAQLSRANKPLDQDATDKAMRVLRISSLAEKVFESHAKAMMWLNRDNRSLGAKPLDLLARESGAVFVEEALLRMEYGVAA